MNDDILKKLIKNTIDNLPIPWEQLWMVFQRIMQCMPQSVPALEGEKQGKIAKKSDKESLWQTCYNTLRNFSGK